MSRIFIPRRDSIGSMPTSRARPHEPRLNVRLRLAIVGVPMTDRSEPVSTADAPCGDDPVFSRLHCWHDSTARSGAEHMAWDQVLYDQAVEPWLRIYRWPTPEVTFGYFMRWDDVGPCLGSRPATRRWTGGGLVEHGDDWTFSLVVPRAHEPAEWSPRASYQQIHHTLLAALLAVATPNSAALALVATSPDQGPGGLCFERPVTADLLVGDRKAAGGAQRRGRNGLLHQGSLQMQNLDSRWIKEFAHRLATDVIEAPPPDQDQPWADWQFMSRQLVADRYGSHQWNRAR